MRLGSSSDYFAALLSFTMQNEEGHQGQESCCEESAMSESCYFFDDMTLERKETEMWLGKLSWEVCRW